MRNGFAAKLGIFPGWKNTNGPVCGRLSLLSGSWRLAATTARETSYYISSRDIPAKQLMELAREHWKIESMHWIFDVTFSEDDCFLSENANRTMNALRKFALAVHKNFLAFHHKKSSIMSHMFSALLDSEILLTLLRLL